MTTPSEAEVTKTRRRIKEVLDDPLAPEAIKAYFDDNGRYAADMFDTVGVNELNSINADDLLAVHLLGQMRFPPPAVRELVLSEDIAKPLVEIGKDVNIWDPKAVELLEGPATDMWRDLVNISGVGWVKAGKLMARKRPRLIPIFDKHVRDYFKPPKDNFWLTMHEALQDKGLRDGIEAKLRPKAPQDESQITTLRLLDIVVWMKGAQTGPYSNRNSGVK